MNVFLVDDSLVIRQRLKRLLADVEEVQVVGESGEVQEATDAILKQKPDVVLLDEPTRGIDIGAKAEIHRLIREDATAGHGVIVVSSEMPELIGLCDRILVMHEGRLAGEVAGETTTEQELIHLATGSHEA